MRISFLSAHVPLTKSFHKLGDGTIRKEPYPLISNFTSHTSEITTILELFKLIEVHAPQGHCLLKGTLDKDLVNEPRKGHTESEGETEWICLDFDRLPSPSIEEELAKLNLDDVSHIVQYSSSQGMPGTEGTISAHVFMLLSAPMRAPELKLWLQNLNVTHYSDDISLSRNHAALVYPVDVTTCQNDKLLYISTPSFVGMADPISTGRTSYVKAKLPKLPVERIGVQAPEVTRTKLTALKNTLRKAIGLKATNAGITFVGEHEVQNKPGEASVTGIKDCGEFTRLNLNGGDSWAYWHPNTNFELLFNFKGEPAYRLKEMCPSYYADLVAKANAKASTPAANGEIVLAFRDFQSSKYFNGTWHEESGTLKLSEARSEKQIEHYMLSHGLTLGAFIPIWNMSYEPTNPVVVDMNNNRINLFRPSSYMVNASVPEKPINLAKACPTIKRVTEHMLGNDPQVVAAFEKWFACIFQRKRKPKACWVTHGTEGTGKGTWFDLIAVPLLGSHNTIKVTINSVEDGFNAWMKNKLLIMVDEIDYDDFKEKGRAANIFKSRITETTFPVRDMRSVTYEYPNTFQFFFASNRPQPVYIPQNDRRYNVARYQGARLAISDEEREAIRYELDVYANYLAGVETSSEIASQILDTEDRRQIAKLGVSSFQEIANALNEGDFQALWSMMPDESHIQNISGLDNELAYASAYASLMKEFAKEILAGEKHAKLSRDQIATIFRYTIGKNIPMSPNKFTSFLRHVNITTTKLRTGDKTIRGVAVKWQINDDILSELNEFFAEKPTLKLRKIK